MERLAVICTTCLELVGLSYFDRLDLARSLAWDRLVPRAVGRN